MVTINSGTIFTSRSREIVIEQITSIGETNLFNFEVTYLHRPTIWLEINGEVPRNTFHHPNEFLAINPCVSNHCPDLGLFIDIIHLIVPSQHKTIYWAMVGITTDLLAFAIYRGCWWTYPSM